MFRGTEVRLVGVVEIGGRDAGNARLTFTAAFTDGDGVVHGTCKHTIDADADPAVREAAQTLLSAIEAWARRAHFTAEDTPITETDLSNGISERFRPATDPSDGVAKQG